MINWKIRFKNPIFWVQLFIALSAPMFAAAGMGWEQLDSWGALAQLLWDSIKSPAVLIAMLAADWGVVVDPTSVGFKDSQQVMDYTEPCKSKGG